jgi:predicted acetyltransferase
MTKLVLRPLTETDEQSWLLGLKDWKPEDQHWYAPSWREGMTYKELFSLLQKHQVGEDLPEGWAPYTVLYGFVGQAIVGRLSIRHRLTESLKVYGGHIGYAVAERFRRKGYGSEMMQQALPICEALGIEKALLTCADDNIASYRIIERLGGVLEDRAWNAALKRETRRYWIETSKQDVGMRCPECRCALVPWMFYDGGFKGVECSGCSKQWWSKSFSAAALEAEKTAIKTLLAETEFPEDAITDQEHSKKFGVMVSEF